MTYLRVVHRWDPLSALMGASPGSLSQVIALSTRAWRRTCAPSPSCRPCAYCF